MPGQNKKIDRKGTQATGKQIFSNETKWPELCFGSREDQKEINSKGKSRAGCKGEGRHRVSLQCQQSLIYRSGVTQTIQPMQHAPSTDMQPHCLLGANTAYAFLLFLLFCKRQEISGVIIYSADLHDLTKI